MKRREFCQRGGGRAIITQSINQNRSQWPPHPGRGSRCQKM